MKLYFGESIAEESQLKFCKLAVEPILAQKFNRITTAE